MSLPEISRRCLTCGAAVRAESRFCHQCGQALGAEAASEGHASGEVGASAPPTREWSPQEQAAPPTKEWTPPTKEWTPPTREFAAFEQSKGAGEPQAVSPAPFGAPSDEGAEPEAPAVSAAESRGEEGEAEDAARAGDLRGRVARVREGTRARVGRMREEAIVVLEETPDDSGLRFVLAAAALFVAFLVLLFLSTTVFR